jgi:hypothetical protein
MRSRDRQAIESARNQYTSGRDQRSATRQAVSERRRMHACLHALTLPSPSIPGREVSNAPRAVRRHPGATQSEQQTEQQN